MAKRETHDPIGGGAGGPDGRSAEIDRTLSMALGKWGHDVQPLVILDAAAAAGGILGLPDGFDLVHADFSRSGMDLILTDNGQQIIIENYFVGMPADLAGADGALLAGRTVAVLAGPMAPAQYAQAAVSDIAAANAIGSVEKLTGDVSIIRADGTSLDASIGQSVFANDVIVTGADSSVGILFVDDTSFGLGANARMVLDEFAFDPAKVEGAGLLTVVQGSFSFISGGMGKVGDDALLVETPTMTIGIRGTKVAGYAAAEGQESRAILLRNDDGSIGKIAVFNADGDVVILRGPNETTTTYSRFVPPSRPDFVPDDNVQSFAGKAIEALPDQRGLNWGRKTGGPDGPAGADGPAGGGGAGGDVQDGGEGGEAYNGPGGEAGSSGADAESTSAEDTGNFAIARDEQGQTLGGNTDAGTQGATADNQDGGTNGAPPPAQSSTAGQSDPVVVEPVQTNTDRPPEIVVPGSVSGATLVNNLGGPAGFGETVALQIDDDGSFGPIDLLTFFPNGLNLFGDVHTELFVNTNGNLTFGSPSSDFTPEPLDGSAFLPQISAFWTDIDTGEGIGGTTPGGASQGTNAVHIDLDDVNGIMTITWDDVGFFSDSNDLNLVNAFQIQIVRIGNGDFDIIFRYEAIDFTNGSDEFGGQSTAFPPVDPSAEAGFDFGNGSFFRLPQSGIDSELIDLETDIGNTGIQGVWQFQIRNNDLAPIAGDDDAVTPIDTAVLIDVLANDQDPEGQLDPNSVVIVAGPSNGTAIFNSLTGEIEYTPNAGFTGIDSFDYRVQDLTGLHSRPATVTVDVQPLVAPPVTNQSPVASDDVVNGQEDITAFFNPLGNDSDPDGTIDPTTVTIISGPSNGTLTVDEINGNFSYNGNANFSGIDTVTYTVNDDQGATSNVATVTYNIAPVNDEPTLTGAPNFSGLEDQSRTITVAEILSNVTAADVDGDSLGIAVKLINETNASWTAIVNGVPQAISGLSETNALLLGPNDALEVSPSLNFNGNVEFVFFAWDQSDGGQAGTFVDTSTRAAGGAFSISSSLGSVNFQAQNDAPTANNDSFTIDEDAPTLFDVLINDVDPEGAFDLTSVVIDTQAGSGTATALNDGRISYTPNADFFGTDTFTYTVADDQGQRSLPATVTITVTPVNDAPTAAASQTLTTPEDTSFSISVANLLVGMNGFDADGDTLGIALFNVDQASGTWSVQVNGQGTVGTLGLSGANALLLDGASVLDFTPNLNEDGASFFSFVVWDQTDGSQVGNTINVASRPADGAFSVDTSLLTLDILPDNDVPTAVNDTASTTEDNAVIVDVLANDVDPEGQLDPVSVRIESGPSFGNASVDGSGRIVYTPNLDFNGTDVLTYSVADSQGQRSQNASLAITIQAINDAPALISILPPGNTAATITNAEQTEILISDLLAGFSDVDGPAQGIVLTGVNQAAGTWEIADGSFTVGEPTVTILGTLSDANAIVIGSDQSLLFTPDGNFTGNAIFTFRGWDQSDGLTSGTTGVDASQTGGSSAFSDASQDFIVEVSQAAAFSSAFVPIGGAAGTGVEAFQFNGATFLTLNVNAPEQSSERSFTFDVRVANQAGQATFFEYGQPGGATQSLQFGMNLLGNGNLNITDGTEIFSYTPQLPLNNGDYHSLVVVVPDIDDVTFGDVRVYQNGTILTLAAVSTDPFDHFVQTSSSGGQVRVGADLSTGSFLEGAIDNFRIFNTDLTNSEIAYRAGHMFNVDHRQLAAFKFDDGQGNPILSFTNFGTQSATVQGIDLREPSNIPKALFTNSIFEDSVISLSFIRVDPNLTGDSVIVTLSQGNSEFFANQGVASVTGVTAVGGVETAQVTGPNIAAVNDFLSLGGMTMQTEVDASGIVNVLATIAGDNDGPLGSEVYTFEDAQVANSFAPHGARYFDGADALVVTGYDAAGLSAEKFIAEARIIATEAVAGRQIIMASGGFANGANGQWALGVDSGIPFFDVEGLEISLLGDRRIGGGDEAMIAAVVDVPNGRIQLVLDGDIIRDVSVDLTGFDFGSSLVVGGGFNFEGAGGIRDGFAGLIDDVVVTRNFGEFDPLDLLRQGPRQRRIEADTEIALRFDEVDGSLAPRDYSPSPNVQVGFAADTGKAQTYLGVIGEAARLDGANDALDIANAPAAEAAHSIAGDLTIELWARPDNLDAPVPLVRFGDLNSGHQSYEIGLDQFGSITYRHTNGAAQTFFVVADAGVQPGVFSHIALTRTIVGGSVVLNFYLNGQLVPNTFNVQGSPTNLPDNVSGGALLVGEGSDNLGLFNGLLDELRIWNVERSAGDIQANFLTEIAPQAGLVSNYRFNGNPVDSVGGFDLVPLEFDSTLPFGSYGPDTIFDATLAPIPIRVAGGALDVFPGGEADAGRGVNDAYLLGGSFSIELDLFIERLPSENDDGFIVRFDAPNDPPGVAVAYSLAVNDEGQIIYSHDTLGVTGVEQHIMVFDADLMPGQVANIALVKSGLQNTIELFLNGRPVAGTVFQGNPEFTDGQSDPASVLLIGNSLSNASDVEFTVLSLALWGQALSHAAVLAHLNDQFVFDDNPNLRALYNFNDFNANIAIDETGNGQFTLNGFVDRSDGIIRTVDYENQIIDANDSLVIFLENDDALLTTTLVSAPQHGVVELGADGFATYIPFPGHVGTDSFVIRGQITGGPSDDEFFTVETREANILNFAPQGVAQFDGVTHGLGFFGLAAGSPVRVSGDLTLQMWVNAELNGDQILVQFGDSGELEAANVLYELSINSSGDIVYRHESGAGQDHSITFSTGLTSGQWHHITLVRDVGNNTIKLFKDGASTETGGTVSLGQPFTVDPSGGENGSLFLAHASDGTGRFKGMMDELRIWERPLSTNELGDNFDQGDPGNDTGLVAHLTFNGPVQSSFRSAVIDEAGNLGNPSGTYFANAALGGALETISGSASAPGQAVFDGQLVSAVQSGGFTIEGWFNPNVIGVDMGLLSMARTNVTPFSQTSRVLFDMRLAANGEVQVAVENGPDAYNLLSAGAVLTENLWAHVAVTLDFQASQATFFVNGTATGSVAIPALSGPAAAGGGDLTSLFFGEGSVVVGESGASPVNNFIGLMDQIRVHDSVLAASDIAHMLDAAKVGLIAGSLVGAPTNFVEFGFDSIISGQTGNDGVVLGANSQLVNAAPTVFETEHPADKGSISITDGILIPNANFFNGQVTFGADSSLSEGTIQLDADGSWGYLPGNQNFVAGLNDGIAFQAFDTNGNGATLFNQITIEDVPA